MAQTTSRTLALLNLLQTHRQWAGSTLAERLGVTARTLRRDIDRLRELGYRVEATRGAAGGYRLEAGAELPPLLLTDEEAVTMAIGLRLAATQGLSDGEHTTLSALAKLEQVLPPALRQRVNALAASVQVPGLTGTPVSPELLGQLALACRDRERIRFSYVASDDAATDRVVEPHSLVATGARWFLVSWDLTRGDWRTFRVDRMARYFGTRVHFAARDLPTADAAEFVAAAVSTINRGRHRATVILHLPLEQSRVHFGPWGQGATAGGAGITRWPVGGDTFEEILAALAWIPRDAAYEIEGSDELIEFVRVSSEKMLGATRPPVR